MEALETKIFITPILIAFEEAAVDINIINKLDSYVLVLTPAFCEKNCRHVHHMSRTDELHFRLCLDY